MTRYYEDPNRKMAHKMAVEHKNVVTIEQLRDILQLIKQQHWPDGSYSDHECNVWSVIREELGISYW